MTLIGNDFVWEETLARSGQQELPLPAISWWRRLLRWTLLVYVRIRYGPPFAAAVSKALRWPS